MDPVSHLKHMAAVHAARGHKHPGHPKDAKVAHPNRNPPPPREAPPMMDTVSFPKKG